MTRRNLQIFLFGWLGVVLLVGACVFIGIMWALNGGTRQAETMPDAAVAQSDNPTPTLALAQTPEAPPTAGPTPLPEPTLPPNQDPAFGYGIQAQLHKDTERTLDMVEQLGLNWIKQQIRWRDLEGTQGQPNWDALDTIFATTGERQTKIMVSVLAAPDWARSVTAEGKEGPPDDYQLYANYVGEMVRRYPGRIHAIELWNEQNLDREWYTAGGLSARAYVDMVALAAAQIRAADPNVIIISGALAPTGWNDATATDDLSYMRQMVDAGLLNHVDCVGAHANGYNIPPDVAYDAGYNDPTATFLGPFANPHPSWSFYSTLNGYHDIIVAAGSDKPLCVTEFGWASIEGMEGEAKPGFEFAMDNSLEEQADNIVNAYRLMHDWGFVKLAFLFNLDYSPKAGGNPQDDTTMFSIQRPDGGPRPAFEAIMAMPKPE
ncbi:MAG: cellulase family glycosylhydrolase [Anaerolineae bacterium]|nr:cellulase family glycosylhydrolase [Anaerolineae bacterium]